MSSPESGKRFHSGEQATPGLGEQAPTEPFVHKFERAVDKFEANRNPGDIQRAAGMAYDAIVDAPTHEQREYTARAIARVLCTDGMRDEPGRFARRSVIGSVFNELGKTVDIQAKQIAGNNVQPPAPPQE